MLETEPLVRAKTAASSSDPSKTPKRCSTRLKVILLLLAALFIIIVVIAASTQKAVVTEWVQIENIDTDDIPSTWRYHSAVSDTESITLTLALKQSNIEEFEKELLLVSDPKSEKYGKHWTFSQVHDLLAPNTKTKNAVRRWLNRNGIDSSEITEVTPNGDFVEFEISVAEANRLLRTEFGYWEHKVTGQKHIRVKKHYFVPHHVASHIDFISPTLRFPVVAHTREIKELTDFNKETDSDSTMTYIFPSTLKELYNVGEIKGGNSDDNYQAVASFLNEWFTDDDLNQFWNYFGIESASVERVPSFQPEGYGSEAELDVQYITSMGEKVNTLVWDIEDDLFFVSLLNQISSDEYATPSVVSMSYGGDEPSVGFGYSMRANIEFGKVGLLGITFFASSGDAGVLSSDDSCNDGSYVATFPASSPYVTAVGGVTGGMSDDSAVEEAWSYSGGGFSSFFSQKSFQTDAINYYLENSDNLPDSSKYVSTGAGYPDLAAQSADFVICQAESYWVVSGTSASCPTVAGLISLVNDARLSMGKSTLGWLNPAIYQLYNDGYQSDYFNDIVDGYNEGCSSGNTGFYTYEGWDPVTGLGSLKFDKLYDYLVKL